MEIKLPLDSGSRAWLESLSVELQATHSLLLSGPPDAAMIVSLSSKIEELGCRARLLIAQSDASHGLEVNKPDPDRVSGDRPEQNRVRYETGSLEARELYRQCSQARKQAGQAFARGKKSRKARPRRKR